MKTLTLTHQVDADGLAELLTPRDDIVGEEPLADSAPVPHRFGLQDGPFSFYERTVEVEPAAPAATGGPAAATGERLTVLETFRYQLPPGTWPGLINAFIRRGLRRRPHDGDRMPLWAPPQRPDARATTVLSLLATLGLVVGYHGTLLGQTMTYVADEFDASNTVQSVVLSVARVGGVLAIWLAALADHRGRRLMLMVSLLGCIGSTALGAITPNLAGLALTQTINRGTWAAAVGLLGVIVAEEMPAGARAYALGLLTMCMGLGAGLALLLLPLADLGPQGWRLLYAATLLMIPVVVHFGRLLPESRRYVRRHRELTLRGHTHYLWIICAAMFLLNLFLGPAPQFRNEFLRDERGFAAGELSLFAAVTATPGSLGILVGGRLAETIGRRVVAAVSAIVGGVIGALSFILDGPYMWLAATAGTVSLAALAPSFTIYNAELFPTSLRGKAAGLVGMVAMGGSVIGLLAAGVLADAFGSFSQAMAVVALGPVLMALIVLRYYPETAFRELEELNPEDALPETNGDPAPDAVEDPQARPIPD